MTNNRNDLLLTSGSQLESRLQLPSAFGGRLEPVRTPALAQLPKPSAPIDLDRLTPEQKKQLLQLRPDLFRKKLQTVYTTYTSSKTHLINGSPSVETLFATVTNVIADGQTPYTVGNSVDQVQFQLPITSSSTHHVILRSRSDAASVTHMTTITHYTTFAQGSDLVTATRKETRSDIRPNPLMMTVAPTGQRRPIVIRRTRSRALNQPQIQATRIHPDQAKLAPIVVVTKQNQYVNRVQQQLQIQQQQQLRQLNALKQQQLALQKQQQLTIQNHYSQVIRQQQLQRSALDNKNNPAASNPITEPSLQARQAGRIGESIEIVNHNSKLKELESNEKKQYATTVSEATTQSTTTSTQKVTTQQTTPQQTSSSPVTSTQPPTSQTTTTERPSSTEKQTTVTADLSVTKKETETTTQLTSTIKESSSPTAETRTEQTSPVTTSSPESSLDTSKPTEASSSSERAEPVSSIPVSTGAPTLRKRRLMFVEPDEIEADPIGLLALPTASAHSSLAQNTLTLLTTDQYAHDQTKPSTSLPHTASRLPEPHQTHSSSLSLSSDVQRSEIVSSSSSSNATADANSRLLELVNSPINGEQLPNTAHSAGMYPNSMSFERSGPLLLQNFNRSSRKRSIAHHITGQTPLINNHAPKAKQITRSQIAHDNLLYFELPASSIDSQNYSLRSSANAIASTQTSVDQSPGSQSDQMSLTYQSAAERSEQQALPTVTHKPGGELTGLVSAIRSTLIIEELTIVYTTEYYGTYIHGVYAHLAKTKSEVISSTPSLFSGITLTRPPEADRIQPTSSADSLAASSDILESSLVGERPPIELLSSAVELAASSADSSQSAPVYSDNELSTTEETPSLSIQDTSITATSEVKGKFRI